MLQELCERIQHCCSTLRWSQNKRNVGSCWLKRLTGFKPCSTTPNKTQQHAQGLQTDATFNIQRTTLHLFARGLSHYSKSALWKTALLDPFFSSSNRLTCLLNFLIKILNEKCHGYTHMLTIRQRRRPWQCRWKIDFASFQFFCAIIPRDSVTQKKGIWAGAEEKGLHPSSDKHCRIYGLAIPVPK